MHYPIKLRPSGQDFTARGDESILDAGLRQGISLPYGCRNGACRSCKGRVLAGECTYPHGVPESLSEREAVAGWALFCQARAASAMEIEIREIDAVKDIRARTLPCRVVRKEQIAHDVVRLFLKLPENERLQFLAGQYIDILLRDGRRRAFSLANAPHEDALLELHVRLVPNGEFSEYVFRQMQERALLRINGPLGSFYFRSESERPAIFLAGGTGFAPIKGIIEQTLVSGIRRPMHLYWGVRAQRDLYMNELAERWAVEHDHIQYIPVLSEPTAGEKWRGRSGYVHEAVMEDFPELAEFEVYTSGPPVMVYAARDAFLARGLDPANLYSDSFDYAYQNGHDG